MEGRDGAASEMRILCLHGFRTSGSFLKKQISSRWDPSILSHFDLDFPSGIYPAGGKSEIEGIFPPPYFEWFQFNEDFTEYTNLEECINYLCEYIKSKGPFDGLLLLSGCYFVGPFTWVSSTGTSILISFFLPRHGKILKDHPPIKLLVSISGVKFRDPSICEVAYKDPIKTKSVHFIGDKYWLKLASAEPASAFENPLIIRHPQGHTVPGLDEEAVLKLCNWTEEILLQHTATPLDEQNIGTTKNDEESKTTKVKEAAARMALSWRSA